MRQAECRADTPPKIYSFSLTNQIYEHKNDSESQTTEKNTSSSIEDSKIEKAAEEMLRSTITNVKMAMVKIKDAYVKKMKKVTVAEVINTVFDNVMELFDENTPLSSSSVSESGKPEVQDVSQISSPLYAGSLYNKDVLELLNDFRMNVGSSENRLSKDEVDVKLESRKGADDENKSVRDLTITVESETTVKTIEIKTPTTETTEEAVLPKDEIIGKPLERSIEPRQRRNNYWELGVRSEADFNYDWF